MVNVTADGKHMCVGYYEDMSDRFHPLSMEQLTDPRLSESADEENSVATIAWHIGGNLASRFTDFLTTDGEKP